MSVIRDWIFVVYLYWYGLLNSIILRDGCSIKKKYVCTQKVRKRYIFLANKLFIFSYISENLMRNVYNNFSENPYVE